MAFLREPGGERPLSAVAYRREMKAAEFYRALILRRYVTADDRITAETGTVPR
jgi:hypothetical protein